MTNQTDFENFIQKIPSLLKKLENHLLKSSNYSTLSLNYDISTYNEVEKFYLDVHDGKEQIDSSVDDLRLAFYAYLGEVVIHNLGGHWAIGNVNNDEVFGTPIILNWGKEGTNHPRISPCIWETFLLRDREKGDIASMIDRAKKRDGL